MWGNIDLHGKDLGFILYMMGSFERFHTEYKLSNTNEST